MKISEFKTRVKENYFGDYIEAQCPFCEEWHFEQTIKQHIARKAMWEVKKNLPQQPHRVFWLENTKEITSRVWK